VGLLSDGDASKAARERKTLTDALQTFLRTVGHAKDLSEVRAALLACLEYLQDSPTRMLLINLEDLWLETKSQNIPSTGAESKNWRRKMQHTWEELSRNSDIVETLKKISGAVTCEKA
jgi:4-alpha-glucanotransferase